jgi:hypothetical protein
MTRNGLGMLAAGLLAAYGVGACGIDDRLPGVNTSGADERQGVAPAGSEASVESLQGSSSGAAGTPGSTRSGEAVSASGAATTATLKALQANVVSARYGL